MDDYRDPPSDPKLAKDMAKIEQMFAKQTERNPMKTAEEDLQIIEAVVNDIRSRQAKPSRLKKILLSFIL